MISLLELGVKSSPQLVFHTMVSCIWVRCGLGIHLESVRHGFLGIGSFSTYSRPCMSRENFVIGMCRAPTTLLRGWFDARLSFKIPKPCALVLFIPDLTFY